MDKEHLQLLYTKLAKKVNPAKIAEFEKTAQDYALDFIHYFDEEGGATSFGRSVGCRFAVAGLGILCSR
jgi:hypothetical protein